MFYNKNMKNVLYSAPVVKTSCLSNSYIKNQMIVLQIDNEYTDTVFAVVTETWLWAEDAAWIDCCQFNTDGYRLLVQNRQIYTGGGLALIYKDKYIAEVKSKGKLTSCQYMVCTIRIRGTIITLVIICHPPYSKASRVTMFIDEFVDFITGILVKYPNIVMLGDFNHPPG